MIEGKTGEKLRILLLEDNSADAELVLHELDKGGIEHDTIRVDSREAFEAWLTAHAPDLILSDYELPSFDGITALGIAHQVCPGVPFIFVTGKMGEELAIDMLKYGATDYVLKQRLSRLLPAVRRALTEAEERRTCERAEADLKASWAKYRAVFESTGTAMCVIDEEALIAEANREFVRMFGGWRGKQAGKRRATELLVPEEALLDEFKRQHWAARLDPSAGAARFETRVLDTDGRELPVLVIIGAIPGTGDSVVSFIDMSKE